MQDYLVRGATIYDGTGNASFLGCVSICGGKISGVYRTEEIDIESTVVIDAGGLALCPGFVDSHTHSDMALLNDGRSRTAVAQGVTTEILGQDGLSYAPMSKDNLKAYIPYLKGLNGPCDREGLNANTVEVYLKNYEGKVGINVAWLVPHCAIRLQTAGFENRLLSRNEIELACNLVTDGIAEGACGFSTGLSYFPGAFSDTNELVEICRAVKKAGGVYVTHLRTVFRDRPFSGLQEALAIARETGVPLHLSHFRTGGTSIGHADELMEPIDNAMLEGLDITLELYPYPYGASYAPMLVPMWANSGGMDEILRRLRNKNDFRKIAEEIESNFPEFDGVITYAAKSPELMGCSFSSIARSRGRSKGETIAGLLLSEELALGFRDQSPNLSAELQERFDKDIISLLKRPNYMVGSDGIRIGRYPHPRGVGSFARIWRIAREQHFPYETIVERMTSLPCRRFGFAKRGQVKPGYHADLVLLDPNEVTDCATEEKPLSLPVGIRACWVNGILTDGTKMVGQVLKPSMAQHMC